MLPSPTKSQNGWARENLSLTRRRRPDYSAASMAATPVVGRTAIADAKASSTAADQRNVVLAGFLGWTFDAFDFFVLTFVVSDVAKTFGKTRPDIALTMTLALAMRPVGALIFGMMADRVGRRIPMMLNVIFFAVISFACGLAP